jgi:hypothetical protein
MEDEMGASSHHPTVFVEGDPSARLFHLEAT